MNVNVPKVADPGVRDALVEAAARLLSSEGPSALSARRLAGEIGTSTMAVYTHFSGMDDLRRAVRREGFSRLAGHLDAVRRTADPVADVAALGWAYCFNALANPHLYRAVFLEAPADPDDAALGTATFSRLVAAIGRCIESGRFAPADPGSLAVQLWTGTHGMIVAAMAGLFSPDEVREHLSGMARHLFVGFGDSAESSARSIERARRRMERLIPAVA